MRRARCGRSIGPADGDIYTSMDNCRTRKLPDVARPLIRPSGAGSGSDTADSKGGHAGRDGAATLQRVRTPMVTGGGRPAKTASDR